MSDFVQALIVICFFLAYIVTVIAKPCRFKFESKVDDGEAIKERCITLENDKKRKLVLTH